MGWSSRSSKSRASWEIFRFTNRSRQRSQEAKETRARRHSIFDDGGEDRISQRGATEFVRTGALEASLPEARLGELDLVIEEIFMNVCLPRLSGRQAGGCDPHILSSRAR